MAFWVKALWDFEATSQDELSFVTGDVLQIKDANDPDWWEALSSSGTTGLVPANRLEVTTPPEIPEVVPETQRITVRIVQTEPSVLFQITVPVSGSLQSADKTAEELDAFGVELTRVVPTLNIPDVAQTRELIRYVSIVRGNKTEPEVQKLFSAVAKHSQLQPILDAWLFTEATDSADEQGEPYVVIHDWEPENPDDLELVTGEDVTVLEKHDHGWWYGKRANGTKGYFPRNYVQPSAASTRSLSTRKPVTAPSPSQPKVSVPASAPAPPAVPVNIPAHAPPRPPAHVPVQSPQPAVQYAPPTSPVAAAQDGAIARRAAADKASRARPFSIRSLEAFDALMEEGVSVEFQDDSLPGSGQLVSEGMRVELNCRAMTWDGANTTTNPFADTTDGAPLCFTVGAGQVTQGLDLSVRKLAVGQRARATCIPKMAYGDAGNPPHVPPHAHVVYEIEVINCYPDPAIRPATGPNTLLGSGVTNRNAPTREVYSARVSRRVMLDPGSLKSMAKPHAHASNEELLQRAAASMGMARPPPPPVTGATLAPVPEAVAAAPAAAGGRASLRMGNIREQMAQLQAQTQETQAQASPPRPPPPSIPQQPPASTVPSPPPKASAPRGPPPVPASSSTRPAPAPASGLGALEGMASVQYTIEQLTTMPYPPGVDPTTRDIYLSEADFMTVFGMSRQVFYSLPKWKQSNLKKQNNFF